MELKKLFLLYGWFFLLRLIIGLTMKGHDAPDEWWQGPEVAYYIVFSKGFLTWEWAPQNALRSVLFPLLFAFPFSILSSLGMDSAGMLFFTEKVTQAFITAVLDCGTVCLASKLESKLPSGRSSEKKSFLLFPSSLTGMTAVLTTFSFYTAFCGCRTYSNVTEAVFVLLAILQDENYGLFLLFSGLACVIRPTAAVALLPFVYHHWRLVLSRKDGGSQLGKGVWLLTVSGVAVVAILTVCAFLDKAVLYGQWVFTAFNFLRFNVIQNVSKFYGVHGKLFYLLGALPCIAGPHVVFLILLPKVRKAQRGLVVQQENGNKRGEVSIPLLVGSVVWVVLFYSLLEHKEIRFVFSISPFVLVLEAVVLHYFSSGHSLTLFSNKICITPRLARRVHYICITVSILVFVGLAFFFQVGANSMASTIRGDSAVYPDVHVLTNCFETPGYAATHGKIHHIRMISCEMHYDTEKGEPKATERDYFMKHPAQFVKWLYERREPEGLGMASKEWWEGVKELLPAGNPTPLPEGVMLFSDVATLLTDDFLLPNGYQLKYSVYDRPGGPRLQLWAR